MNEYVALLRRNANYRNLWLAKLISYLGDWFNLLASARLISELTGSGTAISGLFLVRFLPLFFMSPIAGVAADRFSRRQIMIASDVLRTITVLGFLLIRSPNQLWLLYVLTALQFSLSAFFVPAERALLPSVVEDEDLVAANALDGFTWSTMLAVGSLLGGLATAAFGKDIAFILDALTFLFSAGFVSRIIVPSLTPEERAERAASRGGFFQFLEGLDYLRVRPFILGLALAKAGGSLIWGAVNVLEIPLSLQYPLAANSDGTLTLSLFYMFTGLGTGFGPIFLRRWIGDGRTASLRAVAGGFAMLAVGLVGIGLARILPWIFVSTFVRALGTGSLWVFSSALLQRLVERRFRGRVFAFEFAALTLTQSISVLWAGLAQDMLGLAIQRVFLIMGLSGIVVLGVWLLFIRRYQDETQHG
ncbi:MAG: MFS transporter [Caldilineaceae bacterium]|nr:MFS transporter [Caldilineaceae bacterium]